MNIFLDCNAGVMFGMVLELYKCVCGGGGGGGGGENSRLTKFNPLPFPSYVLRLRVVRNQSSNSIFVIFVLTSNISSGLIFCNVVGKFGLTVGFNLFFFLTLGRNSAGNLDQSTSCRDKSNEKVYDLMYNVTEKSNKKVYDLMYI